MNKVNKDIVILGIESSCDDTSIGISRNGIILANIVSNQDIHEKYGGVVPELASRQHQKNIIPTITTALKKAKIHISTIDGIAFTKGPGLMGSLLVGSSFAKSLSLSLNKPLIAINHMEAHVLANFIDHDIKTPCICLTASGGHTELVLVQGIHNMSLIGQTLDDSAGETFDKCAKIIGLKYPGGPQIEKYAKKGVKNTFHFTIPKVKDLNFSFSGLKTNIIQLIEREVAKNKYFIRENIHDLCASIQHTIIETLIEDGVEMVTTYSDKDGQLVVKHYCALGTEPMFTVGGMSDISLSLVSDTSPGYMPQHDNYVESMKWTLDSVNPTSFRIDSVINMDGEANAQYSQFEKVQ